METFWISMPTAWITPAIVKRLGKSVWLLLLLLSRTTCSIGGLGLVYGGRELRDRQLFSELGISQNTLGRYRATLEETGFVHTKTEWLRLKRWFLIGCDKYKDREVTKWQAGLAEGAWEEIIAAAPEDLSIMLNPLYVDLVQKRVGDIQRQIKDGELEPTSEHTHTSSGAAAPKKCVSISNTSKDRIDDKANEEEEGAFGPQLSPTTKGKTDQVIITLYDLYQQLFNVGRTKPSEEVKENIKAALKRIGERHLGDAIHEYGYQLSLEGLSERPMDPEQFFGRSYEHYTKVPVYMLENSEDGIP